MNMIENLESRQLMSVSAQFDGFSLIVDGDGSRNDIYVETTQKNGIDHLRVKSKGSTLKIALPQSMGGGKVSSVQASLIKSIFVDGKGGDDMIALSSGNSSGVFQDSFLNGGSGNDNIRGGLGKDAMDGGSGNDTVDYSKYTVDVEIRLDAGFGGPQVFLNDDDSLINFENARGGKGNDQIYGTDGKNKLYGGDGNDFFFAGSGEDELYGEGGDDSFDLFDSVDKKDKVDGGSGDDTVSDKRPKDEFKSVEHVL
jgi:Ca2+-binding RTX toxin-like protein